MDYIIKVVNLKKSFGNLVLYKNLNFFVEKNSVCAITGKNGCGKTTLLKILSGLLVPDSGEIFVDNLDIKTNRTKIKKIVGFSINSQESFYPHLTLKENFYIFCKFYNKSVLEFENYINELSLKNFFDTQFMYCSSGVKQKFSFLLSLINNPEIVLIDEITKSVDSESVSAIYNIIKHLKSIGKTIIFVTHNTLEIDLLADTHYHLVDKTLQKIK
jgi:ABC-2 type transport system ATP-binding protein